MSCKVGALAFLATPYCKCVSCFSLSGNHWVRETAGPRHRVWPYSVQATTSLDINSRVYVCLLNTNPRLRTHTEVPLYRRTGPATFRSRLAKSLRATVGRREKPTVLLGETFQLETDKWGNITRRLPARPSGGKVPKVALERHCRRESGHRRKERFRGRTLHSWRFFIWRKHVRKVRL